jgi:hypothetical protein
MREKYGSFIAELIAEEQANHMTEELVRKGGDKRASARRRLRCVRTFVLVMLEYYNKYSTGTDGLPMICKKISVTGR